MKRSTMSLALLCALSISAPFTAYAQAAAETALAANNSGIDMQWVDSNTRPQDNMFQFLSGKWMTSQQIPADHASYGSFNLLRDGAEQQLHELINALAAKKQLATDSEDKKIVDMYASFINEELANKLDTRPLKRLFQKIDHTNNKNQLPALTAELNQIDISLPVNTFISQDARDASKYAVQISQGGLTLPDRDYYLKEDDAKFKGFRAAYLKHVQSMLEFAGEKNAAVAAQQILALETAMAAIQWSRVENRDPVKTYNKVSINKLPELLPDFNWSAYFAANGVGNKVDYVIVRQPSFISGLDKLIRDTPLPIWKSYFKWRTLTSLAPFLSKRFVDEDFAFNEVTLRGIPENKPRWKRGIERVEAALPEALGKDYVAAYFPPENKQRMLQLVNNLILAYRQSIENLTWMSAATKQEALIKLSKFTPKIGYPEKWRDYSKLTISSTDLVGNLERGRQFEFQHQLNKLGKPVDHAEWGMSPQTVNAYYNSRLNEIVFPAAILQPPFFNAAADDAVNYGGIGAVIGHEISHGFDDSGSQSDGDGNLRDWWSKEDKDNFSKLTSALVDQYSAYSPIANYNLNGKLTLGENIADNSGLAIAYKAYEISLAGKVSPVIDGYTGEQRLYMGWAQVWRGKARDEETVRLIKTDPHSPAAARCLLPLKNQPGFYAAFGVKEGDQMYLAPEKRVIIW